MSSTDSSSEKRSDRPTDYAALRLEIGPVVTRAEDLAAYVTSELPSHGGLRRAANGVAAAAHEAERVSRRLRRPFGLHHLPVAFLVLALSALAVWVYWQFFHNPRLVIGLSARDAVALKRSVSQKVRVLARETVGSRESIALLQSGQIDLAFVQGGVEIPDEFLRTKLNADEWVLCFLRNGVSEPDQARKIMTSSEGQGSHSLAQVFCQVWGTASDVEFIHDWRLFTDQDDYVVDNDVDAVFVVKDPINNKVAGAVKRLREQGFRLVDPDIGAHSLRLDYLQETTVRTGYLDPVGGIPASPVSTYAVTTFLVARPDLTARQLAAARRLLNMQTGNDFAVVAVQPTLDAANEAVQGLEAVCGIAVYIGLAFLTLLGLDILAYRRRFSELNSLISLISMHQSNKDVMWGTPAERAHNVAYLSVCSDLAGLIAVITGYYTQENASLLYNRLLEIIHERCNGLKINIQLKILHATIDLPTTTESGQSTVSEDQRSVDDVAGTQASSESKETPPSA